MKSFIVVNFHHFILAGRELDLQLAIVHREEIIWYCGFGYLDRCLDGERYFMHARSEAVIVQSCMVAGMRNTDDDEVDVCQSSLVLTKRYLSM